MHGDSDLWLFGYGSLMWRPGFAFRDSRHGIVRDWHRRFWQGSTDHRGIPGSPGRVVTLVSSPGACCEGIAFRVPSSEAATVLSLLDRREQGGYRRCRVSVSLGEEVVSATAYVAAPDNPEYLGPAALEQIAAQIARSSGPTGANDEYLLELASALRTLRIHDDHVFALEAILRSLRKEAPEARR